MTEYPKILQSSKDSNNMSLTIKGLMVLIVSYICSQLGYDLGSADILNFVELLIVAIGAVWALWGFIRKFIDTK